MNSDLAELGKALLDGQSGNQKFVITLVGLGLFSFCIVANVVIALCKK